mgnify:FL=1
MEKIRTLVRPTVTWITVGVLSYLTITGKFDPAQYAVLVATIVGYWFGSKKNGQTP